MTNNAWNTPTMESVGDGYTLIGSGAGRPAAALPTGDSNVTVTPGANSLTLSSSASGGDFVKISSQSASTSASINFTGLSSTYFMYMITFANLQPDTDATTLLFRTSSNGGSSYDAGASDYAWNIYQIDESGGESGPVDNADASITIMGEAGSSDEMGTASNEKGSGNIYIFNPSDTKYTFIEWEGTYFNESTDLITVFGGGYRLDTTAVNAVQLLMDSGNIASGDFVLYGVVAS